MKGSQESRLGEGRPPDWSLLRRLAPFLRPHAGAFAAGAALLAGNAAAKVAGPYLLKLAIDGPMAEGDGVGLLGYAALYLGLQLLGGGLEMLQVLLIRVRGQQVLCDLRSHLFAKLQLLPISHLDTTPSGQVLARLTADVAVLSDLFTSGMVALIGDVLLLLGILAALAYLDLQLALVVYATLPLLAGVSEVFRRLMRRAYRVTREKTARLTGRLQEFLRGITVLRLFGAEPWAEQVFGEANAEHRDAFLRSVTLNALFYPSVDLLSAVVLALLLWYGGGEVVREALSLGALVAFIEYLQKFFRPVRDLSEKYSVLQSSMAALERIGEFLDLPEGAPEGERSPDWRQGVRVTDLEFAYQPEQRVLRGLDLRLDPGEVVAVVGTTGAGKSTLVNLLLGFYQPTGGEILLGGRTLADLDPGALRREVAVVPQEPFLVSGSILDNIRLGRDWVSPPAARAAADAVGLGRTLDSFPAGLDTEVLEDGSRLSAGQRQLVVFARALAGAPRFLLLDEATAEIDQATEALVEAALEALFRGRTSLVVAHRLATVRRADRVVVLSHGDIVEQGSHRELLQQDGLYRRLYQLQFRSSAR